ncbi:MAG: DUF115 domain-containing protein [Lachnospiraceae bacterium]|nr:DUF115 domain-containing protein [Lachnospiraceae bacterium]
MPDSVYEKNISALRERFEKIADYMEKPESDIMMIEEEQFIIPYVTDVAGKAVLAVQKGDKTYRLDSLYDNEALMDLWFSGLKDNWDLDSKLFMYGLGNGMFVRKFLQRARDDCKVIVHEPSYKIFKTALENFDLCDIFADNRVGFIFWPIFIGDYIKSVYEILFGYTDVSSFAGSFYLNYPQLFPEDVKAYVEGINRVKAFAAANQEVNDNFGAYFCKNAFSNMSLLEESYDFEKLAELVPDDITAIVVAAGPSLDKNIKELAKAKGKSIIISTDTALKPLSLAGIVPDLTAILDGKKDARYLSQEDSRSVPIVCTPRGGTEFLHLHKGMKFFINDYCDHLNEVMRSVGHELKKLDSGGSVANGCFAIARFFGCRRIILVGQDLAYTGDKTHSSVTVRGAKKTEVDELEHVVMDVDINGDPIRSSAEFLLYKEWFESRINASKDLEVIDATEGGIKIEGTTIMPLRHAIEEYCTKEFDFSTVVKCAQPLLDDEAKEEYRKAIRKIPGQFKELRGIIRATLADYSSMRRLVQRNDYHSSRMRKLNENTKKQTKRVENSPVIEYVHLQLQDKSTELLNRINKLEQDEKQDLLTAFDLGEQYLHDMDTAISEIEPYMDIIRHDFWEGADDAADK